MVGMVSRECIGIVTKCDLADPRKADEWLRLTGCRKVFHVNSLTGEGVKEIIEYLKIEKPRYYDYE